MDSNQSSEEETNEIEVITEDAIVSEETNVTEEINENSSEEITKEIIDSIHNEPIEPTLQESESSSSTSEWMHDPRQYNRMVGRDPSVNFQETNLAKKD